MPSKAAQTGSVKSKSAKKSQSRSRFCGEACLLMGRGRQTYGILATFRGPPEKALTRMANEIRFAVGTLEGVRSTIWRLWSNKDDVYLAGRSFAGKVKISFHKSGICRIAPAVTEPRPALAKWKRAKRTGPAAFGLFVIYVPAVEIKDAFAEELPPPQKKLELIKPPALGKKVIIYIVATEPEFKTGRFDFKDPDGNVVNVPYQIVGTLNLPSEIVWVLTYEDDWRADEQKVTQETLGQLKKDKIKFDRHSPVFSAMLHSYQTRTDPPGVTDYLLGPEYFDIPEPVGDEEK